MNEISKKQKCIVMRVGAELWVDEDKLSVLEGLMETQKFIKIDGNLIAVSDILGIYKPEEMEDVTKRKNGMTKCRYGNWHDRGEQCACGGLNQFPLVK